MSISRPPSGWIISLSGSEWAVVAEDVGNATVSLRLGELHLHQQTTLAFSSNVKAALAEVNYVNTF